MFFILPKLPKFKKNRLYILFFIKQLMKFSLDQLNLVLAGPISKIGPNWSYIPHGTESEKVVGPIHKMGPNWSYDPLGTGSNL